MKHRLLLVLLCLAGLSHVHAASIVDETNTPQGAYAQRKLEAVLPASGPGFTITLSISAPLGAEVFDISRHARDIRVRGGDARGLIYGALALRDELRDGTTLASLKPTRGKPALALRAIKYNTPWDTYRPSSALDQHYDTVRDLAYWEGFLDMMVENRFNTITLWTMHPFTYMVRPKNFPEASKWSDAEFAEWQRLYRGIFRLAKERGLDTYIVFWSIFVSEEFSKAHGVAKQNFYPHYYVPGDTSDITKRYLRESVTQVLEEYRDLDGIGVSHGEGMAGMTPLQRQQFVDEVYVQGALDATKTRPVKLIHRVPFSSGLDSGPGVSTSVEQITRTAMEKLGNRFDGPIWVEMKFNWSHGHSTPKLVKVHGGKLGDTYFKPLPSNYKIAWQVRNEDFFALRWGVPDFIRAHVAANGVQPYVGGYFVGSETYIPALDYFSAVDHPQWKWAFERQWLFYELWGRLLYDPKTPDSVFQAEYDRRYGKRGASLMRAMALSSNTQMRLASLYDSRWDFTLYGEGFLALQGEITKYIGIDALIRQPTLDPDYVSVAEYVQATRAGRGRAGQRLTPPGLADRLEEDCREALRLVEKIDTTGDTALVYEVADIRVWAELGLHLSEKLRGAVSLETYRSTGGDLDKEKAVAHLQLALQHWDAVIGITRPLYKDMKLTHYNHNSFDANPDNLFHWARIRSEVAADVDVAKRAPIEAMLGRCTAALVAADAEAFDACFADDITLFNPEIPGADIHRLEGRAAVMGHFRRMFDEARKRQPAPPYFNVKPEKIAIQMLGDVAIATFEFQRDGGSFGRRTFVFANRDGWRITHIHASNTSPQPAQSR
jgi:ketosteroid isomerase-like protein